jgi:hypothetical protein
VQVGGPSPWANNTADNVPGQPGTNYLHSEVEPDLAADPWNPRHLVAVWQQDRWDNGGSRGLESAVTFDGGNTWTVTPLPGVSQVTGGTFQRASDPSVTIGRDGVVYVAGLVLDANNTQTGIFVSVSLTGGLSYFAPTMLITDQNPNVDDKPWITADPHNPFTVYVVWDRVGFDAGGNFLGEPTMFAETTNGGFTWSAPRAITDPNAGETVGNQIVVLPNGTLVDSFQFLDFTTFQGEYAVIRSTDHGQTWSSAIVISPEEEDITITPAGNFVRDGALPDIAVNPNNGNLYVVFDDALFSGFFHNSIGMSLSTDGGLTWSNPIQVNQTPASLPENQQAAFLPAVAVAPNGTVAVSYYDFRNPDNGYANGTDLTDKWIVFGSGKQDLTNPANWGNERRLTTASFNMTYAAFSNEFFPEFGYFVGDYDALVAGGQSANSFSALFAVTVSPTLHSVIMFRDPASSSVSTSEGSPLASGIPDMLPGHANLGHTIASTLAAPQGPAAPRWDAASSDLVFASTDGQRPAVYEHVIADSSGGDNDWFDGASRDSLWTWDS